MKQMLSLFIIVLGCWPMLLPAQDLPTNPIRVDGQVHPMPDPYVVQDGPWYYACVSTGDGVGISRSRSMTQIVRPKIVWRLPVENESHPWNLVDLWAPELHHIGDRWYIYYAAGRRTYTDAEGKKIDGFDFQRSGVLRSKSDDPMGEWEDMGMLYTGPVPEAPTRDSLSFENTEYAIDLTTFELKGQRYAVWSGTRKTDGIQQIRIAPMSNPWTIASGYQVLSAPEKSWEKVAAEINEGPAVLFNPNRTKLFIVYSCNGSWTQYYCLGWLMLDVQAGNPLNPADWRKSSNAVFSRLDNTMSPESGVNGVGHNTFLRSPDGTEDWILYHVMRYLPQAGGGWGERYPFLQRFSWRADGTPDFGRPMGWGEAFIPPSGERVHR